MSEGRILIADDEKEILDVLEMLLVENGYEVVRASNGRQALEHPSEDIGREHAGNVRLRGRVRDKTAVGYPHDLSDGLCGRIGQIPRLFGGR